MRQPQNYENHAKLVPGYHFVITALVLMLLIDATVGLVRDFSVASVSELILPIALFVTAFYARVFPLGVQDRVIRLEERLRMHRVLPEEMRSRIDEVTTEQLIGLRFAPDEELAELTARALDGSLPDRKSIKQAVENWRADHQRI